MAKMFSIQKLVQTARKKADLRCKIFHCIKHFMIPDMRRFWGSEIWGFV